MANKNYNKLYMNTLYAVAQGNRLTGFGHPTFYYNSLDEFIDRFFLAERQCIIQVQRALDTHGFFIFSDGDCPVDFILRIV